MKNTDYSIQRLTLFFSIIFVAWISFFPEFIQYQYRITVYCLLLFFLGLAVLRYGLAECFFSRGARAFWVYLALLSPSLLFAKDQVPAIMLYADLMIPACLVYFLVKNETTRAEGYFSKITYWLFICSGVVALFAIVEVLVKHNFIYASLPQDTLYYRRFIGLRAMSTLMHPNVLGSYLIAVIPLGYYFFTKDTKAKARRLHGILFLLLVLAVFLTYSRGSWLALICTLSIWLWIKGKKMAVGYIWIGVIILIFCASGMLFGYEASSRYGAVSLWDYLIHSHRTNNYIVALKMLEQYPLFGIGLGNFRALVQQYSHMALPYEIRVPESIYFMHLAETGVIGFYGLLFFIFFTLKNAWVSYRRQQVNDQGLLFFTAMSFLALLFNLATYDGFLWKTPFYLFWILAAGLNGLSQPPAGSKT